MARPKEELILEAGEREVLERWARRRKSSQALALRCRIVLACSEGKDNSKVAKELKITPPTVGKWRRRFWSIGLMAFRTNCIRERLAR